jgi:hypothetical protein
MTPEERFTKIENGLGALTEHHIRHAEEIRDIRQIQKEAALAHAKGIQELRAIQKNTAVALAKLAEDLRNLMRQKPNPPGESRN